MEFDELIYWFHYFMQKNAHEQEWKTGKSLYHCLHLRDSHTAEHSLMVGKVSYEIGKRLKYEDPERLFLAGVLHDIGKIEMEDSILKSSRVLSEEDKKILWSHIYQGGFLLQELGFKRDIVDFCSYHHERLNGKGYPFGITDVPREGKIAMVADVFSALLLPRPYRKQKGYYNKAEAMAILKQEQEETQGYDPLVLHHLEDCIREQAISDSVGAASFEF